MGKGTNRRAAKLTHEYEMKLHDFDVRFHGATRRRAGEPELHSDAAADGEGGLGEDLLREPLEDGARHAAVELREA